MFKPRKFSTHLAVAHQLLASNAVKDLIHARSLHYVAADSSPEFHAIFVEKHGCSDRDIFPFVSLRVQQSKLRRHLRPWIAKHRELAIYFLFPDLLRVFHVVAAERDDPDVQLVKLLRMLRELAQLVYAERSPVATIEHQQHLMSVL